MMERETQSNNNSNSSSDITDEIRGYMAQCPQSFPLCKDVRRYQRLMKIGQGTFGEVFKAKHRTTKKIVALKKIKMEQEKEGFPITALREIKILQTLNHVNIVNLRRICCLKPSEANRYKPEFFLVFDFADHDLAGLLSNARIRMDLSEIKSILKQLFTAIFYLHDNNVLHRDMKAANILLTRKGVLKLADFGLARVFTPPDDDRTNRYTARVVTLWYRPPELLLGERNYGPPIDMWGAGCIMTELWTRCPIMQGDTEYKQLVYIVNLCGSITPAVWPDVTKLEHYKKFSLPDHVRRRVKERLKLYIPDNQALDLIDSLLTLDPSKRATAEHALMHDFFFEEPMPGDLSLLFKKHPDTSFFEFLTPRSRSDRLNLFPTDLDTAPASGPSQVSQSSANRRNVNLSQQQQEQKDQQQAFEKAF